MTNEWTATATQTDAQPVRSAKFSGVERQRTVLVGDVVFVGGKRGSGKSTFLFYLLTMNPRFVLYDYKWEYAKLPNVVVVHSDSEMMNAYNSGKRRIVIQNTDKSMEAFEVTAGLVLQMINISFVVEEVDQYATPYGMSSNLRKAIDVGRVRGIGVWAVARRTHRVNATVISNCDHMFIFKQHRPEDLRYLAEFMGNEVYRLPELPEYSYIWYDKGSNTYIMPPVKNRKS